MLIIFVACNNFVTVVASLNEIAFINSRLFIPAVSKAK